jgi:probable phosphoglycerate mutase
VIVVIRHGETTWNAERRIQGQLDGELSELGLRQAEALARTFTGEVIHALYSSDLGRALKTSEVIGAIIGKRVVTDRRLRERHHGVFQGLTRSEILERYPDEFAMYQSREEDVPIPGGESLRELQRRVVDCLEEIGGNHRGGRVVVVTHGGVLDSLFRHTVGLPLRAERGFQIPNASRNTFRHRNGKWLLLTWGNICHLQSLGRAPRDDVEAGTARSPGEGE